MRVIGAVVAGRGVGEYGEAGSIDGQPGRDLSETLSGDGHLDASAGMRPDRSEMEMADGQPEAPLRLRP